VIDLIKSKLLIDAQVAQDKGHYVLAVDKYHKYLEQDPFNGFALNNLSVIYINQAKLELAKEIIIFSLQYSLCFVSQLKHLGIVYLLKSRHPNATKLLEHAQQS